MFVKNFKEISEENKILILEPCQNPEQYYDYDICGPVIESECISADEEERALLREMFGTVYLYYKMKNVFVLLVFVLVATVAAKKGWKLRQRQRCKYDKGAWSECDTTTNTVSRVLTLKSGEEGCRQTQYQTITCDRFERLQAWKVKKVERRRQWQENKQQRQERKQEKKEKKQLVKKQLKKCKYDKEDWSDCDNTTNTVNRVLTLRDGEEE
ncbi:unnamed protein product [Mytilus coruscus]|uniref:Pleiotrophin/Midkine C-terminal domain-containing protein n=1 Tax=Mytilus coruscus TaxID=42192 RepID=A0A6J8ES11_MYTCO|nr:unnamed protein product [Mytilus coruscus]